MATITITLQVCDVEPFLYSATPQTGEEGASAGQINEQQLENFLERLRDAMCTDLTAILASLTDHESRITALEP